MSIESRQREIEKRIAARTAGRIAAENGDKCGANPYPETSEMHWQWLDGWCVAQEPTTPQ